MTNLIPQDPAPWAAKIIALKDAVPFQAFSMAGPHQFPLAPDGRSIAVCEREGGLELLKTSEITDLGPGTEGL